MCLKLATYTSTMNIRLAYVYMYVYRVVYPEFVYHTAQQGRTLQELEKLEKDLRKALEGLCGERDRIVQEQLAKEEQRLCVVCQVYQLRLYTTPAFDALRRTKQAHRALELLHPST